MLNPTSQVATSPNNVNKPGSDALETYCQGLGERLTRRLVSPRLSVQFLVDDFRDYFELHAPVMPRIGALLDCLGIAWETDDALPTSNNAAYTYDWQAQQWVIYTHPSAGTMESHSIMHELYELVWWRCYHTIPDWPEWARQAGMKHPHKTAEDFASEMILPLWLFGQKAEEFGYNPIMLAGHFQTASGMCFLKLLRLPFHIPYIQIRIDTKARPEQHTLCFEETASIAAQISKKAAKIRSNASRQRWDAMFSLRESLPSTGSFVPIEDWICQAIKSQRPATQNTNTVLGNTLSTPVHVVVRPRIGKTFLQIVPVGREHLLIDARMREAAVSH